MALTLRLSEEDDRLLTELAAREHRSKNDVVLAAIRDRAERAAKAERTRAAFARIEARDVDALDLLSQ